MKFLRDKSYQCSVAGFSVTKKWLVGAVEDEPQRKTQLRGIAPYEFNDQCQVGSQNQQTNLLGSSSYAHPAGTDV